jgi:hypothetical protein
MKAWYRAMAWRRNGENKLIRRMKAKMAKINSAAWRMAAESSSSWQASENWQEKLK